MTKTEHRASSSRMKHETSLTSKGDIQKPASRREEIYKYWAIAAAARAVEEQRCALEEQRFGELPVRPASGCPFLERPFGIEVAPREKYYQTSTGDTRDLSTIVVSLALFDGDKMLFACSGIPLPRGTTAVRLTRFVTSSRLVSAYNANRNTNDNLRIEVCLHDKSKTIGLLGLYDEQIAIVTTLDLPTLHAVDLNSQDRDPTSGQYITAAGRAFLSGSLMATEGSLGENPRTWVPHVPTITEAIIGGPVIENGDRFIGMSLDIDNHDDATQINVPYLPTKMLRKRLEHFGILSPQKLDFHGYSLPSGVSSIVPSGFRKVINRLKARGYPMPPPLVLEFNGKLCNQFEGYFGDVLCREGHFFAPSKERVWGILPKEVVDDITQRVVSLKSFRGYARHFACTGLLIAWSGSRGACSVILTSASLVRSHHNEDHIEDNLRINVRLPSSKKKVVAGTLELYNLNWNIAIVSIKDFCASGLDNIFDAVQMPSLRGRVVAIGRDTKLGLPMASVGEVRPSHRVIKLDCQHIKRSTCKINKAGIGGPLINFGGSFVGMNFYDGRDETPFLPRNMIVNVLRSVVNHPLPSQRYGDDREFDSPVHIQYGVRGAKKNRWPVPEPYWCHDALEVPRGYIPELPGRTLQ